MAISYVGVGTPNSGVNGTPDAVTPASLTDGDLMVYVVGWRGSTSLSLTGWNHITGSPFTSSSGINELHILTKVVTDAASEQGQIVTLSKTGGGGGQSYNSFIFAVRGQDTTSPIETIGSASENASAANIGPISGITPGSNDSMVVCIGHRADDWTSVATLSSWTEIIEEATTSGNDAGTVADYIIQSGTASASGNQTFTVTGGAANTGYGIQFSIKPASTLQTVTANFLSAGPSFYGATIQRGAVSVTGNFLNAAPSFFNASIAATYTVTATFLDAAPSFFNATVTPGGVSVTANFLNAAPSFFNATVLQEQLIDTNFLDASPTLFNATLTTANLIGGNFLNAAPTFFNAAVTPGGVSITANFLDASPTFYNASVSQGASIIDTDFLDASPTFYNASLSTSYSVSASFLSAGPTFYNATLTTTYSMSAAFLDASPSFYNATITTGVVSVTATFLNAAPSFYSAVVRLINTLENGMEGTDGTVVTTGNSGSDGDAFDSVVGTGAAPDTIEYDTATKHGGSSSILANSTNTGNEYVEWDASWPTETTEVWVRAYVYITTSTSGAANQVIRLQDSAGTTVAVFRLDAARNPGIGGLVTTTEPSGPPVMPLNEWMRFEMHVPIGNSVTITGRVFLGSNVDGTTPDYEWTQSSSDTDNGNSNIDRVRFGNSTATPVIQLDDVGITNNTWMGPRTTEQPITANFLNAAPSFHQATVQAGAVSITANFLNAAPTFYNAAVLATYSLTANFLDAAPSFFNAAVQAGTVSVTANFLDVSPTFYNAAVSVGAVSITANFLDASPTFYNAAIVTGGQVAAQFLDASPTFYSATVQAGAVSVTANFLDASPTFYLGVVSGGDIIAATFLSVAANMYLASISTGPVTITADFLDAQASFYLATVSLVGGTNTIVAIPLWIDTVFHLARVYHVPVEGDPGSENSRDPGGGNRGRIVQLGP